jgi:hypothetical protein
MRACNPTNSGNDAPEAALRITLTLAAIFLFSAQALAQPGGTVEGAVQYRGPGGVFAGDDQILRASNAGLELSGGRIVTIKDPAAGQFSVVKYGGKDVYFLLNGVPSNNLSITLPVSGKSGSYTTLFSQDMNTVAELSTQIAADSTPAARFMASPSGAAGALSLRVLTNADLAGLFPSLAGVSITSGTTNGVVFRDGAGELKTDGGMMYNAMTDTLTVGGIVVPPNVADDTNGFSASTNDLSGGSATLRTCATAHWHPGAGTISLGDIHAGSGANDVPELCMNGGLAPFPHTETFYSNDFGQVGGLRCANRGDGNASTSALTDPDASYRGRLLDNSRSLLLRSAVVHYHDDNGTSWDAGNEFYVDVMRCGFPTNGTDMVVASHCVTIRRLRFERSADGSADGVLDCNSADCVVRATLGTPADYVAPGSANMDGLWVCYSPTDAQWTLDTEEGAASTDSSFSMTLEFWN